jgi:hypothetical protein
MTPTSAVELLEAVLGKDKLVNVSKFDEGISFDYLAVRYSYYFATGEVREYVTAEVNTSASKILRHLIHIKVLQQTEKVRCLKTGYKALVEADLRGPAAHLLKLIDEEDARLKSWSV